MLVQFWPLKDYVKSVQIRSYFWSVFSGFGLNTERYKVSLRIHSECEKMRTRNNSVFRHFLRSGIYHEMVSWYFQKISKLLYIAGSSFSLFSSRIAISKRNDSVEWLLPRIKFFSFQTLTVKCYLKIHLEQFNVYSVNAAIFNYCFKKNMKYHGKLSIEELFPSILNLKFECDVINVV